MGNQGHVRRRTLLAGALVMGASGLLDACSGTPTSSSGASQPPTTAPAQVAGPPNTVADLAQYKGADRTQILENGARTESALLVYATGTQIQPVLDAFTRKYPFVKPQLYQAGSDEVARRAVEEFKAGRNQADAFELAITGLLIPRDTGVLQPYYSPELDNYPSDARDAKGYWVVVRESYTGLGWNTKLVNSLEAPKTYEELLDPRWKGQMAVSGSPSTIANWVGAMVLTYGEPFVQKFSAQQMMVHDVTSRAIADMMISGEVPMSPTTYNSHVAASKAKGAPLEWRPMNPVPVLDTAFALASKSVHPHAALLLADFLLSKLGQEEYAKIGYNSARADLPQESKELQKLYLSNRPNYIDEFEKWVRLSRKVFIG
jgi:ABC-type Fe3+ transport system substrate-binding protein